MELFLLFSSALASCGSDEDLSSVAHAAASALESDRYSTTFAGRQNPFTFSFAPADNTDYGVNPASRYIVPHIGPKRAGDANWGIGELATLTSRQAIVAVICTPPPVLLWSLETAILQRTNKSEYPQLKGEPNGPGAPVSNTENSATLMPVAARVNAPLVVIMTADRTTDSAVRSAFAALPASPLNFVTIGINGTSSFLNFGKSLLGLPDLFQLCMRVHASAAQANSSVFKAYANRSFPMMLVEPKFTAADDPFYPIPERAMRTGATTEAGLISRKQILASAVTRTMAAAGYSLHASVLFTAVELDKRRCLEDATYAPWRSVTSCLGTSSDGRYSLNDVYVLPNATNMSELHTVVVGANHVASGNAADNQLLYGLKLGVDPPEMVGSAKFYMGASAQPEDAHLFAFAFAANECDAQVHGRFCKHVDPQIAGAEGIMIRLEAYLDKVSGTRPSEGLVQPLGLVFVRTSGY